MKTFVYILTLLFLVFFSSCKENTATTTAIVTVVNENLAVAPDAWIQERVIKAKTKLNKSEAGKIVWQAMEAHGGLERFYANGPLSFHFDYQPLDGSTRRNTYQTVDTYSNKARHQHIGDRAQEFGWTGEKAWYKVKDSLAFPFDMRFWALTPNYFLSQPFVLNGEGVILEKLVDKTHKNVSYNAIKASFEAETGDAPDDYYVLYFGKEDHKLAVIRYIVSYPKYFPNGGHLPEKLMELQGTTVVNGIEFSTGYHTHWLTKDEQAGEHITTIDVSEISFAPETEKGYFEMPEGGVVVE